MHVYVYICIYCSGTIHPVQPCVSAFMAQITWVSFQLKYKPFQENTMPAPQAFATNVGRARLMRGNLEKSPQLSDAIFSKHWCDMVWYRWVHPVPLCHVCLFSFLSRVWPHKYAKIPGYGFGTPPNLVQSNTLSCHYYWCVHQIESVTHDEGVIKLLKSNQISHN